MIGATCPCSLKVSASLKKGQSQKGKTLFGSKAFFEAGSGHVLLHVVQAEGRLPVGVLQLGHGLQVEQRVRHYGRFLGFFVQKVFEANLNFRYQLVGNLKEILFPSCQFFKLSQQKCFYFCDFLTVWCLKLRFVSNIFWTKIFKSREQGVVVGEQKKRARATCFYFCVCAPQH